MNKDFMDWCLNELKNDSILKGIIGINSSEIEIYFKLIYYPMTVEEIACCLGMERSSVYKCINNLYRKGIVKREKISKFNGGGYRYVYFSINPSDLKTIVKRRLDYWINIIESVNGERFEDH